MNTLFPGCTVDHNQLTCRITEYISALPVAYQLYTQPLLVEEVLYPNLSNT